MIRSLDSFIGYTMRATDGEIGSVKEFYFDDQTWTVRYLILETGNWLIGRKVLISPQALLKTDLINGAYYVNITKEQVKTSPDIDTEQPVYRQQETKLFNHYPWNSYWGGGFGGMAYGVPEMISPGSTAVEAPKPVEENKQETEEQDENTSLRSTGNTLGFKIHAADGEIGTFEDFIVDDDGWKIVFLVVNLGNWKSDKKVLISPEAVKEIKLDTQNVIINLTLDQLKNSPDYIAKEPINHVMEENHRDYYGRLVSTEAS